MSKLKWDLTAITSYDYLDYMINSSISKKGNNSSSTNLLQPKLETKVRRNTEKLVTLCATDETFMTMPPSLVAASALVTAIEQDTTVTNNFNLNQIVTNIRDLTKLEIVSIFIFVWFHESFWENFRGKSLLESWGTTFLPD